MHLGKSTYVDNFRCNLKVRTVSEGFVLEIR